MSKPASSPRSNSKFAHGWSGKVELVHSENKFDEVFNYVNGGLARTGAAPRSCPCASLVSWRQNNIDAYLTGPFGLLGREHEPDRRRDLVQRLRERAKLRRLEVRLLRLAGRCDRQPAELERQLGETGVRPSRANPPPTKPSTPPTSPRACTPPRKLTVSYGQPGDRLASRHRRQTLELKELVSE